MPWTTEDYPDSFKNLSTLVRKKAIDIANALVDEGYGDDRAIPIATEQAKEWYENASDKEKQAYKKHGDPTKHSSDHQSRPELLDKDVLVFWQDGEWAVKTKTAKKASKLFETKKAAIEHGKEVAKNKETMLHVYLQNDDLDETIDYKEK